MTEPETIKDRLIRVRSALGWTQQDLAEASGVAAAQISRYESGRNEPRAEMVAKLAKSLDVQFDWLAHGRGPIEGGHPDRTSPPGVHLIEMDLTDEELRHLQQYAQAKGLTVEMAARQLIFSSVANPEPHPIDVEGSLETMRQELKETTKRLDDVVRQVSTLKSK